MHPARSSDFHRLLAPVLALAAVVTAAQPADDRGFDPTGVWRGQHGSLVLMRAGDTRSFSYSAVFGVTAHLCDGIGVAGFVGDGVWQSVDTEGTVTFTTRDGEVTLQVTAGSASFCGAHWPGDRFARGAWRPAFRCRVTARKARCFAVAPLPPPVRPAFVVEGDEMEALDRVNARSARWLLARDVGQTRTTAGLLERDALACRSQ